MPINASHEYITAEKKYLEAQTLEDKIARLQDLIRAAPKHKGSENLLAELKLRLKKFKEKLEKGKKTGKGKKGIRKEGYQCVLVGETNSGKSALLSKLTNAKPFVSEVEFSTKDIELGTMQYQGVKAQIVDLPALNSKDFDYNIVNTADCVLVILEKFDDLEEVKKELEKVSGDVIYVFNKVDRLNDNEKRKLRERCKSKRLNFVLISAENGEGVEDLKESIFREMEVIRVYTKEPGKVASKDPIVLDKGSSVKDVAEKILKGFSRQVKETRLTGPSGKFANQKVGLSHVLKDKDVIEFHTKN